MPDPQNIKPDARVLLVSDYSDEAELLQITLRRISDGIFHVTRAQSLADAIQRIASEPFSVVLMDLNLPDSQGLETVLRVRPYIRKVPFVLLIDAPEDEQAIRSVHDGPQDFLAKAQASPSVLARMVRYAMERHRLQCEVRALSWVDELTGIYNHRGFSLLGEKRLATARDSGQAAMLMVVDLENLESINRQLGQGEGDRALKEAASLLRDSFSQKDLVARLGEGEFAVLTVQDELIPSYVILGRLQNKLLLSNVSGSSYKLQLNCGFAALSPDDRKTTIAQMVTAADAQIQAQKLTRKTAASR